MQEEWRDINGFEDKYQISNMGRVKQLAHTHITKCGRYIQRKEKILNPKRNDDWYLSVYLSGKFYRIHRLVAEAFIPNPNNYPQVNHKDENKQNNCVDNLEWCTQAYNMNYSLSMYQSSEYQRHFYQTDEGQKQKEKISNSLKQYFAKNGSHRKGTHMSVEQVEHVRSGALRGWDKRRANGTDKGYKLVNKDGKCIKVRCEDVQNYLDSGYEIGMVKRVRK